MNKESIVKNLLQAFETLGRQSIFKENRFNLQGENFILALLSQCGGKATPGELMSCSNFTAARLTAISKQLETKGLVTRNKNTDDKRSIVIELTDSGFEQFLQLKKELFNDVMNLVEKLGEEDATVFLRLMNRFEEIYAQPV